MTLKKYSFILFLFSCLVRSVKNVQNMFKNAHTMTEKNIYLYRLHDIDLNVDDLLLLPAGDWPVTRRSNYYSRISSTRLQQTEDKHLQCDVCKLKFRLRSTLSQHLLTHTGQKPYTCDICGQAFTQLSNMKRHKRVHGSRGAYRCPVCNRMFIRTDLLEAHQKTNGHFLSQSPQN